MDIIHLLPDSVANQIAAGEVIQRPASVVKELVENAVDAGATHVDVIAVDAGRTSLQVIDDGQGMSEIDARLAFERHATSKIEQAADLFTLTTKGFRGEALPSIAAVAQVELITRTADDDLGTHLQIEASRVLSQEPVACAVGANFQVKNLFFNVPARRKFLKTTQTELSNITTELERIALVHPDIAFTLTHNGASLMSLPPSSQKQRIANIFGSRMAERLLPVNVETTMVTIHGFVGTPESARRRSAQQFFFANHRYMRHPYFHRAVQEAFTQFVPADQQVPYFIYFIVPPAEIDVNIHPTKTEIKFENEQAIWQILLAAVREALGRFNAIPTIEFDTEGRPADIPVFNPNVKTHPAAPSVHINPDFNPFEQDTETHQTHPQQTHPQPLPWREGSSPVLSSTTKTHPQPLPWREGSSPDLSSTTKTHPQPLPWREGSSPDPSSTTKTQQTHPQPLPWREGSSPDLSLTTRQPLPSLTGGVGGGSFAGGSFADASFPDLPSSSFLQYRGQYILTTVESGLMFIDQHRAHIRILYDRYLSQLTASPGVTQGLLFPDVVQLSATDATTLDAIQGDLHALGLEVSSLGGDTYAINGLPAGLEGVDPQRLLLDLLAAVAERGSLDAEALHGRLALTLARAAAIPTGQVLSPLEMQDIIEQLFASTTPNYTPDGRPIVVILPQDNIEKLFK